MSPFPNEILQGRFNRFLQRLTGIQGIPPVMQLADELHAEIQLVGREPENLLMLDEFLSFVNQFNVTAVAGNLSEAAILNHAGSSTIAIIERVFAVANNAGTIVAEFDAPIAAMTDSAFGRHLDMRANPFAECHVGFRNMAAYGGLSCGAVTAPANTWVEIPIPSVVLTPGKAFGIVSAVVNTTLSVIVHWRERHVTDVELAV